jgi:hypothetical protein
MIEYHENIYIIGFILKVRAYNALLDIWLYFLAILPVCILFKKCADIPSIS